MQAYVKDFSLNFKSETVTLSKFGRHFLSRRYDENSLINNLATGERGRSRIHRRRRL